MVCSCGDLSYWLSPPQGVGQGCGSFQHKVTDVPRLSVWHIRVGASVGDRNEQNSDLSPPLDLTPPSPDMCQSVPGQYGGPVHLQVRHVLSRRCLTATFSPSTCSICHNETWHKQSWWGWGNHRTDRYAMFWLWVSGVSWLFSSVHPG